MTDHNSPATPDRELRVTAPVTITVPAETAQAWLRMARSIEARTALRHFHARTIAKEITTLITDSITRSGD